MKRSYEYLEMNINKVAIFEHAECGKHLEGLNVLPERPARTETISEALHNAPFIEFLEFKSPKPVTKEDLLSIHSTDHVDTINEHIQTATDIGRSYMVNRDSDVIVTEGSDTAAAHAAGAMRDAVKLVYSDSPINKVFCNVRPPGHHAHRHKAEGFCLYNNVWFGAMEARKLLEKQGIAAPRVAIIDWDLHHGDGTQHFVLNNTELSTFFVSIHQTYNSQFPMTGKEWKKERDNTISINHNIKPGGGAVEIQEYFDTLIPELREWKPDIIFISCGFDAHELDTIGLLKYSSKLYGFMTRKLVSVADDLCNGRLISVLEGGYNLQALSESSLEHVAALIGC